MPLEQARSLAQEVMSDPERALAEKIQTELKIGEVYATPFKEGWITGIATAVGAFIPVAPFLFTEGVLAIWMSFTLAMMSHFAVGATRSFFTGRGLFRSGIDMFAVGLGVAGVGYLVGKLLDTSFWGIKIMKRIYISLLLMFIFVYTGCDPKQQPDASTGGKLRVVTTIGMITDIVKNVGGERVEVTGLMGPGVDPHLYKGECR